MSVWFLNHPKNTTLCYLNLHQPKTKKNLTFCCRAFLPKYVLPFLPQPEILNFKFPLGVNQHLGFDQCLGVAPKPWYTPFCVLFIYFCIFLTLFCTILKEKDVKKLKKMIFASEEYAEHPF